MGIVSDTLKHIPFTTEDMVTDDTFTSSIKNHINYALGVVLQQGIGTPVDVLGEDDPSWEEFFGEQIMCLTGVHQVKHYVYVTTQLLFDTPQSSVEQLMKEVNEEALWRARLEFEQWKN